MQEQGHMPIVKQTGVWKDYLAVSNNALNWKRRSVNPLGNVMDSRAGCLINFVADKISSGTGFNTT